MSTAAISNMERGVNGVSLDMMGVLAEALDSLSRKLYNNRDKIRRCYYGKWNLY